MPSTPRQIRYGSLDCIVVDGSERPRIAVILCHGYGAPGHDLAGLSLEWIDRLGEAAGVFRFVFPAARNDLAEFGMPDGRAWWPINMARLAELAHAETFDQLHDEHPPEIDAARELLCDAIGGITDELAGSATPLVLGGFSQGAMLAMDASLRGPMAPPVGLFQFSGTLICGDAWEPLFPRLTSTVVFQSHGKLDPILPFSSAETLRDRLIERGVAVEFYPFDGPHTIDPGAVERTTEILRQIGTAWTTSTKEKGGRPAERG